MIKLLRNYVFFILSDDMLSNVRIFSRLSLQSLIVCIALTKLQQSGRHFATTTTTTSTIATKMADSTNKDGKYTAVLIGATGATGKYLFAELVQDKVFIKIFFLFPRNSFYYNIISI